ncbi:FG-GAP and VCBS repeat-containing protein [Streptomyces umbrinus]|uniref:FG-GAP and VCBS repeat-containing protein n=1 Tax=Streptomyces umbrinus TaxID=67370 RepID=UPI0033E22F53
MKRQLRTTTALAAILAAGVAPLTLTTPASAAAAKYADDFNGDGFRDYAVYSGGDSKGGGVEVTFGTANGPGTRTQLVDQASPGVPGADEADDWFGEVRTAADFDKDGHGDIAVGTAVHSKSKGRVSVWYGSSSGPSTSTRITQATSGVAGTPETYDEFGWSVSAGDANGDGYKDLAVGVIGEAINGKEYAGGVHVLYGRASGLSGTRSQWFARNSAGVPGALEEGEHFGYAVRLRDTNADGRADLYVRGSVNTLRLPGSPTGVTTTGAASAEEKLIEGTLQ